MPISLCANHDYLAWISWPHGSMTEACFRPSHNDCTVSWFNTTCIIVTLFTWQAGEWSTNTSSTGATVISGAGNTITAWQRIVIGPCCLVGTVTFLIWQLKIKLQYSSPLLNNYETYVQWNLYFWTPLLKGNLLKSNKVQWSPTSRGHFIVFIVPASVPAKRWYKLCICHLY